MGNGSSSTLKEKDSDIHVFEKELASINNIITNLITDDGKQFKTDSYNLKSQCSNYTIMLESKLKRHLKVDLLNMKNSIYLVPLKDAVFDDKGQEYKKEDLCKLISQHYDRVLKLIHLVKLVYDIEHAGDNSIAGITWRNIRMIGEKKLLVIHYCGMSQKKYDDVGGNNTKIEQVDFMKLKGFSAFVNDYLTNTMERNTFIAHFESLLDNVKHEMIARYAKCGDVLLDGAAYNEILGTPNVACSNRLSKKFQRYIMEKGPQAPLTFTIASYAPVFHSAMCAQENRLVIDISNGKDAGVKGLLKQYGKLKYDYVKNLNAVLRLLQQVVTTNDGGKSYELVNIDSEALDKLEAQLKKEIAVFYLQSVANYQQLLNLAKKMRQHIVAINEQDEIIYSH